MAVRIPKRPVVLSSPGHVTAGNLERVFRHYDAAVRALQDARVRSVEELPDSAALADVIQKVNELIGALKEAGLMEE